MAEHNERTTIWAFPQDDPVLADYITRLTKSRTVTPASLEELLKVRFPAARVQVQERLGMNGTPRPHWYIFRDGWLRQPKPARWEGDGVGHLRLSRDGIVLEADSAALEILDLAPDSIVGALWLDLIGVSSSSAWPPIDDQVCSTAVLCRDGSVVEVEYRVRQITEGDYATVELRRLDLDAELEALRAPKAAPSATT